MARDPYKYFRIEARELLDALKQAALDLEKEQSSAEVVARALRFAHTLKGAARVVRLPDIAQAAHALEDALEPFRESGGVPRAVVDGILVLIDGASAGVSAIAEAQEDAATAGRQPQQPTPASVAETVRIEIGEMDRLLEGVAEATIHLNVLRRQVERIEQAAQLASIALGRQALNDRASPLRPLLTQLRADLEHIDRTAKTSLTQATSELSEVRAAAHRLRLAPVSMVFATLERAARDAAQIVDKRIEFRTSGGGTRLDAQVLAALQEALLQIIRNAVAHGIEPVSTRRAAGKDLTGRIELRVEHRSSKAVFTCSDDGAGIDVDGLKRAAVEAGALEADGGLTSVDALLELMLRGGLTTTSRVTQVSGRAIGLDVVREVMRRLQGEVRVRTARGKGTTFEVIVPIAMNTITALVVRGGGVTGALALQGVRETLSVKDSDILRIAGSESLPFEGKSIPFAPLARVLRRRGPAARDRGDRGKWSAVVFDDGTSLAAIGVDQLLGTSEVVVRSLPAYIDADPVVLGSSLDAEGNPELVFDAAGLVSAARSPSNEQPTEVRARLPILVIDDSLTTRMLEQSILESAGYHVDLATSAEEGIEKARRSRYGVFVVDVEMPGMDGFEFVSRTRADPELRVVPAILVTSRGSQEDRRRGRDAGAVAYVVKGEFNQAFLLDTIRELNG